MHRLARLQAFAAATALILWAASAAPLAQTYTMIHSFNENDGCCANWPALLAEGRDGRIYSTTTSGGTRGWGNVWVMTPSGALTPIYNFSFTDGAGPQGGLNIGFDGNLYGVTYQGGSSSAGTVFKITPAGGLTVIHSFTNTTDGGFPRVPPTQAPDGNLYGVTGNGTIAVLYKITPSGTFSVVMPIASQSYTPMIVGDDGMLYGMTLFGGTSNRGTAFQYNPAKNKLKTVYSFTQSTGDLPQGPLVQGKDLRLYGTATDGGAGSEGVVFQMTTAGKYLVIHNFDSTAPANGMRPYSGVVQGSVGYLYGVTTTGGSDGLGVLYKLTTKGAGFAVLHDFNTVSGDTPASALLLHTNGTLYGMTSHGGSFTVYGAMYSEDASLKPYDFPFVFASGKVGDTIPIFGSGLLSATEVKFGSGPVSFTPITDSYMTATIDDGATTGTITVNGPSGKLTSPHTFKVLPTITGFSPQSGPVGTQVTITGTSLLQTKSVVIGKALASFTVDSDTQITATVGAGAITGKVALKTLGGSVTATGTFVVQ